ncbi:MAG: hypothetical protein U1F56_18570 [Rubrivivax sp.]
MAHDDDTPVPRRGRLSAFALLKSWLLGRKAAFQPSRHETEFLNTRDGHELARFAKQAFGGEGDVKREKAEAVAAEQAEIDALLQGTGAIPMPPAAPPAPPAPPVPPPVVAAPVPPRPAPAPAPPPVAASATKPSAEAAVQHLEALRQQGFSVEMLAEALIVIESRDVKSRNAKAA